jgi:hypothetical protein
VRDEGFIEARIRELERGLEAGEGPGEPDRRFLLGALHHRQGRLLEAARWYLAAARVARDRGEREEAAALVRLAREIAPASLDVAREQRRLAAHGKDG